MVNFPLGTFVHHPISLCVSATQGEKNSPSFLVDSSSGTLPRVIQRTKNGITTRYVYGPGNLGLQYEVNSSGSATYYHYDQVGNTTALTDSHGAVVERVAYSPYGLARYRQSNFDTPFLYGGFWGVMSDVNGLINMRARYYNPLTCRFINSDPAHDGWNWYAYAHGDPIGGSDPSGLLDNATPWQLGVEWLTGTGPRTHNFTNGDPMTVMLEQHSHIQDTRNLIMHNVASGGNLKDNNNYSLSGLQGVPKYVADYSTLASGGLTGNLAVTYLGSYELKYSVTSINPQNGAATVNFQAANVSSIASATHPPVLGYTDWWNKNISTPLNNVFKTGPMSPKTQNFNWNETISPPSSKSNK